MRKFLIFIVLALCSFQLFAATETYKAGNKVYVSVKQAKLDSTEVFYGDVLVVDDVSGKKLLVHKMDDETITGWISSGCVTRKKIIKNEDGQAARASTEEISLAGKGFSEGAEQIFKSENPDLDFGIVDRIEEIGIDESKLEAFIEEGKLCAE